MTLGWWVDVCSARAGSDGGQRTVRWLVGIEDENQARRRLEEEINPHESIVRVRQASPAECERYGVGRLHLRQV